MSLLRTFRKSVGISAQSFQRTNQPRHIRALSASPRNHLKQHTTDFTFLPNNSLPSKPRKTGLTEIRGPYYAPVTQIYLDELLKDWGEYVDGVKFAGGSFSLMPPQRLKGLIEVAHNHGRYVSTGGFIERVLSVSSGSQGMIKKYLTACKDFGWGAGGDASVEELESAGTRDPKWLIDRAKKFLDAGAYMIMIESEGITENVKEWKTDAISAITSGLPKDKIMFEAADPKVFAYHIQNQGADTNLFVDHSQIVQLACLRKGVWGTGGTFSRVVTFEGYQDSKKN